MGIEQTYKVYYDPVFGGFTAIYSDSTSKLVCGMQFIFDGLKSHELKEFRLFLDQMQTLIDDL